MANNTNKNSSTNNSGSTSSTAPSSTVVVASPKQTNNSNPKVTITSDESLLASNGVAKLTFTFSTPPVLFSLEDIKVTNGAVTSLVQDLSNPHIYTAQFSGGVSNRSGMSTIKVESPRFDSTNYSGNPSNTLTIKNVEKTIIPTVGFTTDYMSVTEGNNGTKVVQVTVSLSAASKDAVSVNYATRANSAKENTDYIPMKGTLNFAAGETSKTISVEIVGDTVYEGTEYFYLDLTSARGADVVMKGAEASKSNSVFFVINNDDLAGSKNQVGGIYGTTNKDTLGGSALDDLIDGRGGADIITGYAGNDTFAFAASYAVKDVASAARILDFKDGVDHIGLRGNLKFSDLVISDTKAPGGTALSLKTGETLAVLVGVKASAIDAGDFAQLLA